MLMFSPLVNEEEQKNFEPVLFPLDPGFATSCGGACGEA